MSYDPPTPASEETLDLILNTLYRIEQLLERIINRMNKL